MIRNIITAVLLVSALLLAKAPQQEAITKTLAAEKGGTLEVKLNPGEVFVKTWNKNEVLIKVDGLDDREAEELHFQERNGNVSVEYEGEWGWGKDADYYFTIPETYNLDISTTGGDIIVSSNIDGSVKVQTMGGELELLSVTGHASMETMGGEITVGDIDGSSYISTQGGDIKAGNLKGRSREIKTMGGDISIQSINEVRQVTTYGGDLKINTANKDIEVTTFGGDIRVTECKEGIKANTYGGNIRIGKANGTVDASTGGGNIELKNISGAVRAKTAAGNILVELINSNGRSSNLRTAAGDIEFIVGAGTKLSVDAEVDSYWGDNSNSLRSDFDGKISVDRDETTGTFRVNGGGAEVKLRVNNGTINIKKK